MDAFFNDEGVLALFSNKEEGFSEPPYDSLNVALHVGDDPRSVLKNRTYLSQKYGFLLENFIYMDQVHSDAIKVIDDPMFNRIDKCDAVITNKKNIPLMVMVADCIPILMYDKDKKVIAAVHSGRSGTFKNIATKTVLKMKKEFSSGVENILICMGPSIGACCYEVGRDIANTAKKEFGNGCVLEKEGKFFLDLKWINLKQLKNVGIKEENIEISDICTCCDKNYFSYRRDGKTGRFAGIIMLRSENDK